MYPRVPVLRRISVRKILLVLVLGLLIFILRKKSAPISSWFFDTNKPDVYDDIMAQLNQEAESVSEKSEPAVTERVVKKPWFMKAGESRPEPIVGQREMALFPQEAPNDDRIVNQLMYVPPDYENPSEKKKKKTILLYHGELTWWNIEQGSGWFTKNKCPVDSCSITTNISEGPAADIIIFRDQYVPSVYRRDPKQIWMLYMLECPYHSQHLRHNDIFNWTATYRQDSDIVTPYEKWVYYDDKVKQKPKPDFNYAAQKTKLVAWFVSNCAAKNNRLQYADQLRTHIEVDIYGSCGKLKCPRSEKCFQMLDTTYKFYLAFENSNCVHYVTEKLFVNGLQHNVLPIVMGARPEDYANVAPYHSYIHVDEFESPKHLAEYLLKLDKDDDLYNSYFLWKGTGEFINTYFFCRVCSMIHADRPTKTYRNVNDWWRGSGTCTNGSWRKFIKSKKELIKPHPRISYNSPRRKNNGR